MKKSWMFLMIFALMMLLCCSNPEPYSRLNFKKVKWSGADIAGNEFVHMLYQEVRNAKKQSSGLEEADVVFVENGKDLTKDDFKEIMAGIKAGEPVILIDPEDDVAHLLELLGEEDEENPYYSESPDFFFKFKNALLCVPDSTKGPVDPADDCDAIGIRNNDVYFITAQFDTAGEPEVGEEVEEEVYHGETPVDGDDDGVSVDPVDYDCLDRSVESFCNWIMETPESANDAVLSKDGGAINLAKYTKEYTQRFFKDKIVANGPWTEHTGSKYAVVTYTLNITPVFDFNQKKDYYIFEERIFVNGTPLQCGPSGEKEWNNYWDGRSGMFNFKGEEWDGYYGDYVRSVSSEHSFERKDKSYQPVSGAGLSVVEYRPFTTQLSHSISEGLSWNLGGQVGLGTSGPSVGLSGGISYSNSTSETIPDLKVTYLGTSSGTKWVYEI